MPVRYERAAASIRQIGRDGRESVLEGDALDAKASRAVLERTGEIARIEVAIPEGALLAE